MKKTPQVRFILARRKIVTAIERGHRLKAIYDDLGGRSGMGMAYSLFCRYVKRLNVRSPLAPAKPPSVEGAGLVSSELPQAPANLASTSYSASISQIEALQFPPARKGDAERLFKRAEKDKE